MTPTSVRLESHSILPHWLGDLQIGPLVETEWPAGRQREPRCSRSRIVRLAPSAMTRCRMLLVSADGCCSGPLLEPSPGAEGRGFLGELFTLIEPACDFDGWD